MEVVLEHSEVDNLLRQALKARGTTVPPGSVMRIRRNNKLGTIRIVFTNMPEKGER